MAWWINTDTREILPSHTKSRRFSLAPLVEFGRRELRKTYASKFIYENVLEVWSTPPLISHPELHLRPTTICARDIMICQRYDKIKNVMIHMDFFS